MSRGGRHTERTDPERRCIATGESAPKGGLIRFVVGPDDTIFADVAEKLPGRGIWVSATREALATATKKGLFARAARAKVTVPDGLADAIEERLSTRVVEGIALARKAGEAVAGFEKVKSWLIRGDADILMQARDGSEDMKRKLRIDEDGTYIACLWASELGLAFGRDRVIHAALKRGGIADHCKKEALRLRGMRSDMRAPAPVGG